MDKCVTELGSKTAWKVGESFADPAHEPFGLDKAFLQLAAEARSRSWRLVI